MRQVHIHRSPLSFHFILWFNFHFFVWRFSHTRLQFFTFFRYLSHLGHFLLPLLSTWPSLSFLYDSNCSSHRCSNDHLLLVAVWNYYQATAPLLPLSMGLSRRSCFSWYWGHDQCLRSRIPGRRCFAPRCLTSWTSDSPAIANIYYYYWALAGSCCCCGGRNSIECYWIICLDFLSIRSAVNFDWWFESNSWARRYSCSSYRLVARQVAVGAACMCCRQFLLPCC